jgi:hypothetical protein
VNINMLRDADNDPGIYVAACAADPNVDSWPGCTVFVSVDGGTTYVAAFGIPSEATMGRTIGALGNFFGGNRRDELNHIDVQLSNGTLSSTNNAGLRAGVNCAVVGDEILFFRDAPLIATRTYRVRGFLRGRRGSEYAMASHVTGERFVMFDQLRFVRVPQATADIGVPKKYKAVSNGMTLASATAQDFTNEGTGLKPFAPVHLGGGRDASNNATLACVRRNRISGEWRNLVDVPMSEATEAYEWDIFTDGTHATVLRTLTSSTPTVPYSAANQTTDGITPGATIYFGVAQMSAVVGRGHMAYGSI